jgi:hypothetical protein
LIKRNYGSKCYKKRKKEKVVKEIVKEEKKNLFAKILKIINEGVILLGKFTKLISDKILGLKIINTADIGEVTSLKSAANHMIEDQLKIKNWINKIIIRIS